MPRIVYTLVGAFLLGLPGCGLITGPDGDDGSCPQSYEFGNYGCARLVVLLGPLPADAPLPYRWKVSAQGESVETFEAGRSSWPEEVELHLTFWLPLPAGDEADTVTVVAEVRDDSGPIMVGVPLPLFAVDSVRYGVRAAPVGERPPVDTVRLTPSTVSGS